jgi:nucleotide-binding universal stress UspA family protein
MKPPRRFTVLVATDGTHEARAAVVAASLFPWPPGSRVYGVIARRTLAILGRPQYFVAAFDRMYRRVATTTRQVLAQRWPAAEVRIVDATPVGGILDEARRVGAGVIVMGSRARGRLPRLLLGSVARQVVRRASCAALVVRGRPRRFTRFTLGVDGSQGSRQAVDLLAALRVPRGGRSEVREGRPLTELLRAATEAETDALVVGAGGTERLLLGGVTEGLLNQAALPVLAAGQGTAARTRAR